MSKLFKNIIYNLLGQGIVLVVSFLAVKNIFNQLGAEVLGIIYFTAAINAVLTTVLDFGFSSSTVREVSGHFETDKKYVKDFADYKKALAAGYIQRGFAYNEKKEYDKAISDYIKAIDIDPSSPNAYNGRGLGYHNIGKYDKAVNDYTTAIMLKPDDSGIYNNRAMAYYFKGDYDKAMADLMKAIELNPKDSLSYYNIACLYSIKNNIEEACNWLSKAIENGYNDWDSIKQDKDLANFRNTSCYKKIISGK